MRKITGLVVLTFIFLFVLQAHAQSVSGSIGKSTVKRGTTVKGKIVLDIPEGVHVNSSLPETEFAIPTTLKISGSGVRILKIAYQKGADRKFEFSETPINVYEKQAVMNFSFYVPQNFKGKTVSIRAVINYQACTTEVCYPPVKRTVNLTAAVR